MARQYTAEQRERRNAQSRAYNKLHRKRLRALHNGVVWALIIEARSRPCIDCGRRFPPGYMHLDHVRGEKRFQLIKKTALKHSVGTVRTEIAKCDTRCPICHSARHLGDNPLEIWANEWPEAPV